MKTEICLLLVWISARHRTGLVVENVNKDPLQPESN
jgi:hypothetical protein